MTRNARSSLSILMALTTFACGGGSGGTDAGTSDTDAGPVADAGPSTTDAGRRDAGASGNDSFETATPIEVGTNPGATETLNPAGESDYFRFDGMEGDWIVLYTTTDPMAADIPDTVITLYDASMTQIAENDDAQPRVNTDSEIVVRLPATGTYYYRVQEFSTWAPDMVMGGPVGGRTYAYETGVATLRSGVSGVLIDAEPGNDAASATAITTTAGGSAFVLGRLDTATDVDVFTLPITATDAAPQILDVEVMPAGPSGYGATRSAGRVWVTDAMGTIIARSTIGAGITGIQPSFATTGEVRIFVEAPSGAAGTNDHYVLKVFTNDENPLEGTAPNETLATAEMRTLGPAASGMGESSFVLARLPAGDVDYFALDVMAGRALSIACGSRRDGSGVLGLSVEVRDASDMVLTSATETATDNLFIDAFAIPSAGRYYVRLASTGQDAEVTGDWVRCGMVAR